MRQGLDIAPEFLNLLKAPLDAMLDLATGSGKSLFQILQISNHQCNSLIDVVVQFSGDPGAFLLMRLDQLAAHTRESFLVPLALFCQDRKEHERNRGENQKQLQ